MATLSDLGFSEYEVRVYRTLLSAGPTTAKGLSQASDVPMGRIYDVLNDLEAAGMIRSQNMSQPKKYAPIDPDVALERCLESKRTEFEEELRTYEETVEELSDQLNSDGLEEQFWTVAVGPEDSINLLEERLSTATDQIIMVADAPSAEFDPVELGNRLATEMETALDRGVEVSLLIAPELLHVIPDHIRRRYRTRVSEHSAFEMRLAEDIVGSFTLIDRVEVCIEVPNPLAQDEMLALIDLTDPSFATNAYEEFRPRWEQAELAPKP